MEETGIKGRLNARALGLDDMDVKHDEMVARLKRIRAALSEADIKRMFVRREEDEFFFAVGYYLLTPLQRKEEDVRLTAVFRGYLALRYLDTDVHAADDLSPFERYRQDVAGDLDEFSRLFRAVMRFRVCHRCYEAKPIHAFRLSASTVCKTCLIK